MKRIHLELQPDGSLIDWGRHWRLRGVPGDGPALWYTGEAAEVLRLVLRHTHRESAMTITIVDDDPGLTAICEALARFMGFETECFGDGQDFLDNYTPKAGVVLLGIGMPRKCGDEVLRELNELGWNLNVVTMSAEYGSFAAPRFLALGAKSHLPKPFSREQFEEEINRALGRAV